MKSGNFQGRVHFGNLGVDGRMLLKYNFRQSGWENFVPQNAFRDD
jgi:hypothetical protein